MDIASLKRKFLNAMPVVGPHADIEAELLLAGKKPLGWLHVAREGTEITNPRLIKHHKDRLILDQAVAEGKLISKDAVYTARPDNQPPYTQIVRHYAQPHERESLETMVEFNQCCFNGDEEPELDKDIGRYLGYRRRDILFFKHVIMTDLIPDSVRNASIKLNAACQDAHRDMLLEDAGYDLSEWYDNLPKSQP